MRYGQMIDTLQQRLPLTAEQVEAVLTATVQALGETARNDEMQDLRSQLPGQLKSITSGAPEPDRSLDVSVLVQRISQGQAGDLAASLPVAVRPELPTNPAPAQSFDTDDFLDRIQDRAGLPDRASAEHLTGIVLSTIREWAPTELGDTADQLPKPLARLIRG